MLGDSKPESCDIMIIHNPEPVLLDKITRPVNWIWERSKDLSELSNPAFSMSSLSLRSKTSTSLRSKTSTNPEQGSKIVGQPPSPQELHSPGLLIGSPDGRPFSIPLKTELERCSRSLSQWPKVASPGEALPCTFTESLPLDQLRGAQNQIITQKKLTHLSVITFSTIIRIIVAFILAITVSSSYKWNQQRVLPLTI